MSKDVYEQMVDTCLLTGIPLVSMGAGARLMAIIYVHGNHESLVYNPKLRADVRYIQKKYGIVGGRRPDMEFVRAYQKVVKELEEYEGLHESNDFLASAPEWVSTFLQKRYGINKI